MDEREKWDLMRTEYVKDGVPLRQLAQKYGISESRVYKKATSEGWKKLQEKTRQKADERFVARASRARARELDMMASAAANMAQLLNRTVEALQGKPPDEVVKSLKGLGALGSAIKANTEALMTIYGVQTPAQVEAQKIARKRLALEERKQRFEEGKQADEHRDKEVALTITVRGREEVKADGSGGQE